MNFLQLLQRAKRKCRVSGSTPTTVVGQVEEYNRLIDWVNESWMDIQLIRQDWNWMRASASFPTVLLKPSYTPNEIGLTDFGNWKRDTFRSYVTAVGQNSEAYLDYIGYDQWLDEYRFGAIRNSPTRPMQMTVCPDFSIGLGPVPIAGYTITGDYFRVATEMANDADIPALPPQFHMAIVYKAMMYYGESEAAAEVFQSGQEGFKQMMSRIAIQQLAEVGVGGALA